MKRGLDPSDGEDKHPETKRQKIPALASVIVEALKVDSLQKLCSSLEPILRRVVSEEVERALAKLGPARLGGRVSPKQIEGPDGRNLQLHFRSRLALPLFTGGKVEGEQGAAIHVVLLDANTGHIITSGPESSAKLDIFVLEGDFNNEDDDNWTEDDFEGHVVKEREGKRPLLTGELHVSLKEGVGTIGELTFTDNSSWIRSRKFRLGLKIASDFSKGMCIREAKTEAFTVKDHRGELYKKHYPPNLQDEVWRLEKIGKDGSFHKRLNKAGVYTVEDFLRIVVRDLQKLRNILGSGMSNKMWESLVEHSKTCVLSGKYYVYYSDGTSNIGAIFNNIFEFSGLIASGQYYSAESLTESQKVFADTLVKRAYDNWMHVVEYDGKAISAFKKTPSPNEAPSNYMTSYDQQVSQQVSPTPEAHLQLENTTFIQENHFAGSQITRNDNESVQTPDLNMYNWSHPRDPHGVDDFFSEEEIRMRSHEMLENDDMQHLLRVLGGGSTVNLSEDGFGFSSYVPSPCPNVNFEEDRGRPSGKAVVGWLKIRAAMRWGIFVRKKAAERRAQLVELEE